MSPPRLAECEQQTLSGPAHAMVGIYHVLREAPIFRQLLLVVGPLLQVVGRKQARPAPNGR